MVCHPFHHWNVFAENCSHVTHLEGFVPLIRTGADPERRFLYRHMLEEQGYDHELSND